MNEPKTFSSQGGEEQQSNFSLIEMTILLARHKKLLLFFPFGMACIAAVISFAIPNVYMASANILPPQQPQSGAAALLSQFGGIAGVAAGAAGIKNPNDLYVAMLRSRSVADSLISQFDLKKVYGTDSQENARRVLQNNTAITAGKDGLISIVVEDERQTAVAKLANAYVAELTKLTKVLVVTEASKRRLFFEQQLEMAKNNLAKAEMTLKRALDTHGVISVDSDSRAIVETIARLRAQVSAKEIQLSSMSAFVTANNQEYKRGREELNSLMAELSKLENGRPSVGENTSKEYQQAGLENIKVLRDVKYYQMLYELLSRQYEAARLDEAKDASIIQILDPAITPEKKFKPRRALITLFVAFGSLLAILAWLLAGEIKRKVLLAPTNFQRWSELKSHLRFK